METEYEIESNDEINLNLDGELEFEIAEVRP